MTNSQLDAVYTSLCKTLTSLGETKTPLFLARFALLALVEINDQAITERLIEAAAADMPTDSAS